MWYSTYWFRQYCTRTFVDCRGIHLDGGALRCASGVGNVGGHVVRFVILLLLLYCVHWLFSNYPVSVQLRNMKNRKFVMSVAGYGQLLKIQHVVGRLGFVGLTERKRGVFRLTICDRLFVCTNASERKWTPTARSAAFFREQHESRR